MIDDDECGAVGGMRFGSGTEVLGENLPQCHFPPGLEPGPPWKAGD
jgi:hypothetical protein